MTKAEKALKWARVYSAAQSTIAFSTDVIGMQFAKCLDAQVKGEIETVPKTHVSFALETLKRGNPTGGVPEEGEPEFEDYTEAERADIISNMRKCEYCSEAWDAILNRRAARADRGRALRALNSIGRER